MAKKEYDDQLEELEEKLSEEDDHNELPPTDIVAYNELRSCADILRMYENKQLVIQPDFQRDVVWSKPAQTRFIDSLIKQLPIPSMCISFDPKTNERLVIDGLQRISSIIYFLRNDEWKLSKLDDIDPKISGKSNLKIKDSIPTYYSRVENLTIPITVIRCDYSKKNHKDYLFTIFHRLNTGGNKLTNQEIRNCIYSGSLNKLLSKLTKYENYVKLFNIDKDRSYRFAHEEFILRFLAFYQDYESYNGKLAKYLNDFMDENRHADVSTLDLWRHRFERTVDLIYNKILREEPLPKLSKATAEGVFVGVGRNIESLEGKGIRELKSAYTQLRKHKDYSVDNLKEGLSRKDKVIDRLKTAEQLFSF